MFLFRHVIFVKKGADPERMLVLVCSVIKLVAGNSFMSLAHKALVCFVKRLLITWRMLNIVDIVIIITLNL